MARCLDDDLDEDRVKRQPLNLTIRRRGSRGRRQIWQKHFRLHGSSVVNLLKRFRDFHSTG